MPFDPKKYIQEKQALGGAFDPKKYIAEKGGVAYIPPEQEGASDPEKKFLDEYKSTQDEAENADTLLGKAGAGLKAWQMGNRMERPGPGGVPYATPGDVPIASQDPNAMTAGDAVMGLSLPAAPVAEGVNAVSNAGQALTRAPTAGPGPEVMEAIKASLKGKEIIPEAVKDALSHVPLLKGAAQGTGISASLGALGAIKHNPGIAAGLGGAGLAISPMGSAVLENKLSDIVAKKVAESRAARTAGASRGMLEPGNIDLANRPRVKNPDGSISTVRSMGVNINGKEVLIPTVSDDGRSLSPQQAVEQYKKTGKHLGIFSDADSSTAYAKKLHEQQAKMLEQDQGAGQ